MSNNNNHNLSVVPWFHWPHMMVATGFGVGFWPWGSGTLAGFIALVIWVLLYFALPPFDLFLCNILLVCSTFFVGVYTDNVMERYWGDDPRTVVIDEFFGTWVATLSALFCLGSWHEAVAYAILSFSLFRIIDIFKPFGCRWIDKNIHGGLGCMLDDLLAGFYAIIITFVVRMVVGYFG